MISVITERDIELFNDSLGRCGTPSVMLTRFYEIFLTSSVEVTGNSGETDFTKQRAAVAISFYTIMSLAQGADAGVLDRVAQARSHHGGDIGSALHDEWLECLLTAVRGCDTRFTPETEQAWRVVMGRGIEFLKSNDY